MRNSSMSVGAATLSADMKPHWETSQKEEPKNGRARMTPKTPSAGRWRF